MTPGRGAPRSGVVHAPVKKGDHDDVVSDLARALRASMEDAPHGAAGGKTGLPMTEHGRRLQQEAQDRSASFHSCGHRCSTVLQCFDTCCLNSCDADDIHNTNQQGAGQEACGFHGRRRRSLFLRHERSALSLSFRSVGQQCRV